MCTGVGGTFGFHAGGEVAKKPKFFPLLRPAVRISSATTEYRLCTLNTSRGRSEADQNRRLVFNVMHKDDQ